MPQTRFSGELFWRGLMGFFLIHAGIVGRASLLPLAYDTRFPVSAESEDGAVKSRDQQLSPAVEAGCIGGVWSLRFHFVPGPLHGYVVRDIRLAPPFRGSPCRPPSGGHYSSQRRRPARVSASLSCTWFERNCCLGLTLGLTELCGTEPYFTGQFRWFEARKGS